MFIWFGSCPIFIGRSEKEASIASNALDFSNPLRPNEVTDDLDIKLDLSWDEVSEQIHTWEDMAGHLGEVHICAQLSTEQQNQVRDLCDEYKEVFISKPGQTKVKTRHHIRLLEGTTPIAAGIPRMSPKQKEIILEAVAEMLREGVIQQSTSPWRFPVVLVNKPDGSKRVCINLAKLNACTKFDSYPIPHHTGLVSTTTWC